MVRFKNRYLLCLIDTEHGKDGDIMELQPRDLLTAIRSSLSTNFGDFAVGQSMSSLAIKLWSPALAMCIIRCSRDNFKTVWAAISLIVEISSFQRMGRLRFTVVHVGGTIRACQKSAAQRARRIILEKKSSGQYSARARAAADVMQRQLGELEV